MESNFSFGLRAFFSSRQVAPPLRFSDGAVGRGRLRPSQRRAVRRGPTRREPSGRSRRADCNGSQSVERFSSEGGCRRRQRSAVPPRRPSRRADGNGPSLPEMWDRKEYVEDLCAVLGASKVKRSVICISGASGPCKGILRSKPKSLKQCLAV